VQTRVFGYPRNAPNVIATSFIAQALLDACELGVDDRSELISETVAFLLARLRHDGYFTYLEGETELVHNANALACAVLARGARVLGHDEWLEPLERALRPTLEQQRDDGSWPYAERAGHDWVDNFHTAYVLEALAECGRSLPEVHEPLQRGVDYWRDRMFLPNGRPKYYVEKALPLDAHCYATAIDTWVALSDHRPDAVQQARRVAQLLVADLMTPAGYVRFQRRQWYSNSVPLIRWSTAPSFKALAGLQLLEERGAAVG
jgi:hypothetical protein